MIWLDYGTIYDSAVSFCESIFAIDTVIAGKPCGYVDSHTDLD